MGVTLWYYYLKVFTCSLSLLAHYRNLPQVVSVISIFTNPSTRAGYDTRSTFKRSLTGLNSEFSSSCLTKAEEPSLSYYLPIAGGRIIGFIPFPRVLVLCEMQSVSSRIWTRVVVSISYDDNHYTTGTSVISVLLFSQKYSHRITNIFLIPGGRFQELPAHQPDKYGSTSFLRWVLAPGRSPHAPGIFKKCLGPRRNSSKDGRLVHQAINPTPPKRVKAWGGGPLRLEVSPVMRHTRPEPCSSQHGRPKCDRTTGEAYQSRWLWSKIPRTNWRKRPTCGDWNYILNILPLSFLLSLHSCHWIQGCQKINKEA